MDGNKDDALKCLKIAKDSIESGDKNRALKFLKKARRLDPSIDIDDFLSDLSGSGSENPSSNADDNPSNSSKQQDSGPRRRVSVNGSSASSSASASGSASAAYTEEQVTIVREIKGKKDYYEILGLEKSCSVEDVKKAYRKLSLKVHPDKNKAPGAEEVFKMVSKAFQCLSNEESRKKYDLVGSDEPVYDTRADRRGGMQGFNGFYCDGDIDADEIFRNFFFGGMHPATRTQFGGFSFGPGVEVRMGGDRGSNGLLRTLLQLLPVILILLLNFLPSQQPIYSLSSSYPYDYRLTTQKGVNYYVKSGNFEQEYPPSSQERMALERQVEGEYYRILAHNCRLEMQQLHWGYRRETPNCEALKRFEATAS
ncbi:hypothetical protein ACH5RR_005868 [Cinchona calisaya]|uniref:J domain-containing protein n=1 Tax=Cinchona calisaya TaxID=153742 RepID=A0ABD3AMI9_9GENT